LQASASLVKTLPAMKRFFTPLALGLSVLVFTGCVAAIGNRDNQPAARSNATLGQQLIDLQKAREVGAITPEQYEEQKAKLLGGK
jgi:hypothetical protein